MISDSTKAKRKYRLPLGVKVDEPELVTLTSTVAEERSEANVWVTVTAIGVDIL